MLKGTKVLVVVPNTGEVLKGSILRKLNNGNYTCRLPGYKTYQEIPHQNILLCSKEIDKLITNIIAQVEIEFEAGLNVSKEAALKDLFNKEDIIWKW